jgi:glycerol kinase
MESLILAVDQGTTNTKCALMGRDGRVFARASRPVPIAFPESGWVEQDALALWQSVIESIGECLSAAPCASIAAIGISNQRESAVVWERRTGQPVGPCITWQCRRTAPFCAELRSRGLDAFIKDRSGLGIDPLFSASKIRWLLDRTGRGEFCAGTVDSWLLWQLTGGAEHATDATNASRTQLLNLREAQWDPELLSIFGIPRECLPAVKPSSAVFGRTVQCGPLAAGIPIASMIGDSHAALFGHAAFEPGSVKATYGTGSSLMTLTDGPVSSSYGLSGTIAWATCEKTSYALEGNITNTGGTVQWAAEFLELKGGADEAAGLAATIEDSAGLYVVPAFAGLGAPYWDPDARGLVYGLTRSSGPPQLARAALESIAFQVRDVFEAMRRDMGRKPPALLADGGASRNDALMQFQADVLDCAVVRSASSDLAMCGAAWLAGLTVGYWTSLDELRSLPREAQRFEPRMSEARRARLIAGWQDAVGRARSREGGASGGTV